jgi:tetratricopeptide (TPR) repeat protein
MPGPVLSERDLAVLRSFAGRIDPSDAGAHNNLGVLYHQKGLIEEAIGEFVKALELDPRMQVAQDNLEIAYRESGHYDRRIAELREGVRRRPEDREGRWELARAYAALGRFVEAIAEFESLLAWHPHDVPAMLQLGLAEKARGELNEASEWLERACAADPASAVARFYAGEVFYNRGLNDAALGALREAIARNPDYAEAHYLLAFVYGDLGQHEAAREATKRAIALNPTLARAQANLALERFEGAGQRGGAAGHMAAAEGNGSGHAAPLSRRAAAPQSVPGSALAHFNLGLALRQKGYHQEALKEYRNALEAGEDRRLNLQAMAEVHLLRRELGAALELYEGLVRDYPDSPKLWNERGVCLHQAGRRAEAVVSYERAVGIDSAYQLAWNNLGVVRAHESNADDAIAAFRQALGADRPLLAARLNLGLLSFQRRQFRAALEEYQQALAEQPASAVAWNGVGLVLMELRRFEDARNAFGRAVDADADFAAAHYNLSFVLSQLGDFDGALRETRRALELEALYVPQKFSLTIDLQFEDPTIAIAPELAAEIGGEELSGEFEFDAPVLDRLFEELAPGAPQVPVAAPGDALDLARDYIGKGLLDLALAEVSRATARGAPAAAAAVLQGDGFAQRGRRRISPWSGSRGRGSGAGRRGIWQPRRATGAGTPPRCPAAPPPRSPFPARPSPTSTSAWRCGRRGTTRRR